MAFPSFNDDYYWPSDRPDVPDTRIPIKNGTEYHGYQKYAYQYASQGMYEEAAQSFQLAADWRNSQMEAMPQLINDGHSNAAIIQQNLANYYGALARWQQTGGTIPSTTTYNLTENFVNGIEAEGQYMFMG